MGQHGPCERRIETLRRLPAFLFARQSLRNHIAKHKKFDTYGRLGHSDRRLTRCSALMQCVATATGPHRPLHGTWRRAAKT